MQQKRTKREVRSLLGSALLVLAVLLLTACNSLGVPTSTSSAGTSTGGKNPADIHVGFVSVTSNLDFALEMAAGAQYAANQFHVSAQIVAPPDFDDHAALNLFTKLTQTAR